MKNFLKKTVNIALAMTLAGSICIGGMPDMTVEAAAKLPEVKIGQEYTMVESDRLHLNFNREWKFDSTRVTDDNAPDFGGALNVGFDDSSWTEVGLPHSFSIPYNMEPSFFVGYGLYRKVFNVPEEWIEENKKVSIEFEGAFIETEVFINGQKAGDHLGGYTGFEIDLTSFIKAGENTLAVRVNNKWRPDQAPRIGEHHFSGGIYRDVYLNVTNPVHVAWYGTAVTTPALNNPGFDEKGEDGQLLWDYECIDETAYTPAEVIMENIKKKQSDVAVSTEVKNETGSAVSVIVRHIVVDKADEKVVAYFDSEKTSIAAGEMVNIPAQSEMIKNIKLWDLDNPNLYRVETIVYNADTNAVIDTFESPLGFRWAQFLTDGMHLNGERIYLFGAGFHQDRAGWGDAGTNVALKRDVAMVKEAGMNFIRAVTYPREPALVAACDEYGILFWSENTFWGMGGHLNAAKDSKTITYTSADWDATAYPDNEKDYAKFNESCLQDMEEMIRVLRNHPSMILWSSGNEVFFETNDQVPLCKALLKDLRNLSHKMDPTRKVALGGTQRGNLDSLEFCDVAGYNGDGGKFNFHGEGNSGSGMGQWGITMKMPCMASEYGSYTSSRGDKADTYAPHFHEISDGKGGYIESDANRNGIALWCAFHHGTIGGAGLAQMGFVDYSRLPLKTWYWYRENYNGIAPEFSQEGEGTKLQLSASQTTITNDGTSDAQLIVTVVDDEGNWVNEVTDIDIEVVSGPGVFPTGKAYKFTKGNTMRDGKGSIDFHSWYSGETVIRVYADGLESDEIIITTIDATGDETKSEPENFLQAIKNDGGTEKLLDAGVYGGGNFIANRPTNASSGKATAALATDGKKDTFWQAEKSGAGEYWQVFTEFSALVYKMRVEFPEGKELPYTIETSTSSEGPWTTKVSYNAETVKNRPYEDDLGGSYASYIRVSFPNITNEQTATLTDVYVYAMAASTGPTNGETEDTYTPETVYLSDIQAEKLVQGWEGQNPGIDVSIQGKPLTIGGVVYKKGLGLHASSEAIYSLDKKYTRFQAVLGIDDEVGSNAADAIYRIYVTVDGEEKLIYEKHFVNNVSEKIDLSVRGAEKLRLVTDSNGRNSNDHTNWADARLVGAERSMSNGTVSAKIATNSSKLRSVEDFEVYLTLTNTGVRAKYITELTLFDENGQAVDTSKEEITISKNDVVYKTMIMDKPSVEGDEFTAVLSIYNAESEELLGDNVHIDVRYSSGVKIKVNITDAFGEALQDATEFEVSPSMNKFVYTAEEVLITDTVIYSLDVESSTLVCDVIEGAEINAVYKKTFDVLGENLISNGSFEDEDGNFSTAGWLSPQTNTEIGNPYTTSDFYAISETQAISNGDSSAFDTTIPDGKWALGTRWSDGATGLRSIKRYVGVESGKTYLVSYKVKNTFGADGGYIRTSLVAENGAAENNSAEGAGYVGTDWITYTRVFTATDDSDYVQFLFRWLGGANNAGNSPIWLFDDFSIIEIAPNKIFDYTMSESDNKLVCNITVDSPDIKTFTVVIAQYDENHCLVNAYYEDKTVELTREFEIKCDKVGKEYKVFFWESLEKIEPIE